MGNHWLASIAFTAALAGVSLAWAAEKKYGPGISDTEIKIGNTMPYSGPLSTAATIGRTEAAYFRMLNERGGINGRKITFITLDDAYNPAKTVEQVRKLVEQEEVLAVFNIIGTPTAAAVQRYLNDRHVPELFIQSGAPRFDDPQHYPWTMSIAPGYVDEARAYAKYLLQAKPEGKIGVLYQNDDFGKAYLDGLKQGLGDRAAKMIVMEAAYEPTDPTVDTQIVSLQASGADVLLTAAIPRMTAQTIRKVYDIGWRPLHIVIFAGANIPTVLKPAGLEKSVGLISAGWGMQPGDPRWEHHPDYESYVAFMKQYYPGADTNDPANLAGYGWASTLAHVLDRCGDDLTRENLMHQATHMKDFHVPSMLPGIVMNTSPTDYRPIKQFILQRFDGQTWVPFSGVIEVSAAN
jgi:ABC-type branched-subunit amino acid transport system substrate-binding protein